MLAWDPDADTHVLLNEEMVGTTAFMAPETCVPLMLKGKWSPLECDRKTTITFSNMEAIRERE